MVRFVRSRKAIALVLALGLVVFGGFRAMSWAQEKKEKKAPLSEKNLMLAKLVAAQDIMQGLALGNFDQIRKNADELHTLSKKAEWTVMKTERYDLFSAEFRRTLENIQEKAKEKNLDGVTLSFMELTMTCVKCHKYCRDERRTSVPVLDPKQFGIGE